MGTIATTTTSNAIGYPAHAGIARDPLTGHLYFFGRPDASNNYRVWKSIDFGASWTSYATFNRAGIVEWSSITIDRNKWLHVAYRFSDGSFDRLFYRRLNLTNATWSAELQVSGSPVGAGDANGGVAGGFWQGVDLAVVQHSTGAYAIAVVGANTYAGSKYGITINGVSISASGTVYLNNSIITNNRAFQTTGTAPGATRPSCEVEHNGDGYTSSTPHLWITWGRNRLYMVKLSWQGTSVGWQGPNTFQTIDSTIPGMEYVAGRWDGSRWLMAVVDTDDASIVDVYERNRSNTFTTLRQTPQHPNGTVRTYAITYDGTTKNPRVYAVGTTNATLYHVDFVRATGLWGTWVQVSADTIQGTVPDEFTTRRGGTTWGARYDIGYTTGAVSPFTLKSVHGLTQYAPNTPMWDTSTQPYTNGGAANVNTALTLDWSFVDVDPADAQASYALRRQIGAGAFSWWRTSDSTWQAVETFNATATTALTLASGWGAGTDANHSYVVKTRDTGTLDSPYSAALVLIPSVQVSPVIITPTAAQVLTTNFVTVTWTAAEQKHYRVQLVTNPGGVVAYDSGFVVSGDLTFTVPYELADGTGWQVWLTTTNNEGLPSAVQTRAFTVDYVEPPAATLAVSPQPLLGLIRVTATNPAPSGAQPAFVAQDVYRRVGESATLNANPTFAGNVTGWAGVGGTLSYSTVQAHEGAGSARIVPTGAAANSYVEAAHVAIDPARAVLAGGWVRPDTVNKPVQLDVRWYTAGGAFISATSRTLTPPIAAVWQYVSMTAAPVATAARASVALGMASTPAAGDAAYVDELVMQAHNDDPGVRVAASVAAGAVVDDWRAAARQPYEYRAVTYGANGTQIASPWQA